MVGISGSSPFNGLLSLSYLCDACRKPKVSKIFMHFESLKVVSEHLVERIKLEETGCRDVLNAIPGQSAIATNIDHMNRNLMCSTMFLMNEGIQPNGNQLLNSSSKKHEVNLMNLAYEKSCNINSFNFESANSFIRSGIFSGDKSFLNSRGQLQLTAQECGELFLKKISESNNLFATEVVGNINLGGQSNMNNTSDTPINRSLPRSNNDVENCTLRTGGSGWHPSARVEKERPFACPECSKSFVLKHHLVTHIRVHSGDRPHVCTACGKSFAHKHCLSTHMLLHTSQRPYECNICKKSFTLKHHLVTHSRVHSRDRPFVCQECGRTFPQKRHLVTHGKFHSGERPFVCEECGESFSQKEHLVMHSRFHGGQNSFACSECSSSFARKFELVNHERLHGRQPHACQVCGKEFLQKRTLVAHVRLHAAPRAHVCQQCGEMFAQKADLGEHVAMHREKAFACHAAAFPGVPPHFLCPQETGKAPTASAGVQTDAVAKSKPHVCADCGRCFSQKHGLTQHNRRHRGGEGCEVRTHVCAKCGKAFFQKNHLALHSRQHMDHVVIKKEACEVVSTSQMLGSRQGVLPEEAPGIGLAASHGPCGSQERDVRCGMDGPEAR